MLRTVLASFAFSILIYLLSVLGVAGVPLEIGRIFLIVFLTMSTLVMAARLAFGRHPTDVL